MAGEYFSPISKITQIKALLYKAFILQARQIKTNIFQILFPVLIMICICSLNITFKSQQEASTSSSSSSSSQESSYNYNIWGNNYQAYPPRPGVYYIVNPDPSNGNSQVGNNETGLLSLIPATNYSLNPYTSNNYIQIQLPLFDFFNQESQIDESIVEYYKQYIDYVNDYTNYQNEKNVSMLAPTEAVIFTEYKPAAKSISYIIEDFANYFTTDFFMMFLSSEQNEPGPFRITTLINNAFLQTVSNSSFTSSITPYSYSNSYPPTALGYMMSVFMLPCLFSFIFPVFVYTQVFEKEEKHTQILNMMGLTNLTHISANLIFFTILYLVLSIFVVVVGAITGLEIIVDQPAEFCLLVFLYGLSLVSFSFFYSTFFWKSKLSTVLSYLIMLIVPTGCVCLDMFGLAGKEPPFIFYAYPSFSFGHGLFLFSIHQLDTSPNQYFYEYLVDLSTYSPLAKCYLSFVLQAIVFLIAGNYLGNVLPKEHGFSYPILYPIYELMDYFKTKNSHTFTGEADLNEHTPLFEKQPINSLVANEDVFNEDGDCKTERSKANSSESFLLKAINLKKIYNSGGRIKEALFNFCLTSNEGEILGLLGPNGAGKTTFIHLLCGMYKPTSGEAYINGYKISSEMGYIYRFLSFCPQHDILYDDLTIMNHLNFYYDLKGLFVDKITKENDINYILQKVQLFEHRSKKINQLSGGQKRRVSISIALLGKSKLILLDEPSTGLDPDAKRTVWDIIESVRNDKTIIITTHNMQEADVLCNKIAIVASGRLQCVGSPLYLKNKFGAGYTVQIVPETPSHINNILETMKSHYPESQNIESDVEGTLLFVIPKNDDITILFTLISENKQALGVKEWGISQTSLEDVFMKMVEQSEASEK